MGNHRSSSIYYCKCKHYIYIFIYAYTEEKGGFWQYYGGFYSSSLHSVLAQSEKPSAPFSTYFAFGEFVQQVPICDRQHPSSYPWHSGTRPPTPPLSASAPNAQRSCSGVLKPRSGSGAEAGGSPIGGKFACERPDTTEGGGLGANAALANRLLFKVLGAAQAVWASRCFLLPGVLWGLLLSLWAQIKT